MCVMNKTLAEDICALNQIFNELLQCQVSLLVLLFARIWTRLLAHFLSSCRRFYNKHCYFRAEDTLFCLPHYLGVTASTYNANVLALYRVKLTLYSKLD